MTAFKTQASNEVQPKQSGLAAQDLTYLIGRTEMYAGLLAAKRGHQLKNTYVPEQYRNPAKFAKDSEHLVSIKVEKGIIVDAHVGQYRVFMPGGGYEEWVK